MRIEIRKVDATHWYFNIVASNGKPVVTSGFYARKRNAVQSAELLRDELRHVDIVERP